MPVDLPDWLGHARAVVVDDDVATVDVTSQVDFGDVRGVNRVQPGSTECNFMSQLTKS